jgi:hypothetical protein
MIEDIKRTNKMEMYISIPFFINKATKTPVKATKDPTERSIPPPIIIRVSPIAKRPYIATCLAITCRLKGVINFGLRMVINTQSTIRAMRMLNSLKNPLFLCFSVLMLYHPF